MTATQFIYIALRQIGQLRQGQAASVSQNNDGLTLLNNMLEEWSTERTNIFTIGTAAYSLTTTQNVYPIGPTATAPFAVPRPIKIERAGILVVNPNGSGTVRFPLQLLSEHEWDAIAVKISSSPIAEKLYSDNAFPNANLYLLPIPTWGSGTAPKIELSTWAALTQFPDLTTDEEFPPGYAEAIQFNLCLKLVGTYPEALSSAQLQDLAANATASKAAIRALNAANFKEDAAMAAWMAAQPADEPGGGPVNALMPPQNGATS